MANLNENDRQALPVSFAAIDPYVETHIVTPREKTTSRDWVEWGDRNRYPDFLLGLSKDSPTLRSVIMGTVDFIVGDDITIAPLPDAGYRAGVMNPKGTTIREQARTLAFDRELFGGFALQAVRNAAGKVVAVYHVPMQYLRSNKENTVFYYSEKWNRGGLAKVLEYPKYMDISPERWQTLTDEERERNYNTILFVKNDHTQTYPLPDYCAAVKDCLCEVCISDYHLNSINNGFSGSLLVNFNDGKPSDEIRKEIERMFNEKFSGHQNAGRIIFSWNSNKEKQPTLRELKVEDFGEKYKALALSSRQHIFTAFRATPIIFGIPTDNNGFSNDDYDGAFRLYNRTTVRPAQQSIIEAYERLYGQTGIISITPFSLAGETEQKVQ